MRKKCITVRETGSIQNSAKEMNNYQFTTCCRKLKPTGLITERDLVRKICIENVRTSDVKN
jgi:hypothetical protein